MAGLEQTFRVLEQVVVRDKRLRVSVKSRALRGSGEDWPVERCMGDEVRCENRYQKLCLGQLRVGRAALQEEPHEGQAGPEGSSTVIVVATLDSLGQRRADGVVRKAR